MHSGNAQTHFMVMWDTHKALTPFYRAGPEKILQCCFVRVEYAIELWTRKDIAMLCSFVRVESPSSREIFSSPEHSSLERISPKTLFSSSYAPSYRSSVSSSSRSRPPSLLDGTRPGDRPEPSPHSPELVAPVRGVADIVLTEARVVLRWVEPALEDVVRVVPPSPLVDVSKYIFIVFQFNFMITFFK
jgi:hypothetical protein